MLLQLFAECLQLLAHRVFGTAKRQLQRLELLCLFMHVAQQVVLDIPDHVGNSDLEIFFRREDALLQVGNGLYLRLYAALDIEREVLCTFLQVDFELFVAVFNFTLEVDVAGHQVVAQLTLHAQCFVGDLFEFLLEHHKNFARLVF